MASNRRRFESEGGEPRIVTLQQDELRMEAEDAVEAQEAPELGEEPVIEASPAEVAVPAADLPVCWIWARLGAVLRKADGTEQETDDGTLLAAYGWVPRDAGQVAVNLGDQGKWFIQVEEWVVYRREV